MTCRVARRGGILGFHYNLRGDQASLVIPESASRPVRRDYLWKSTCFEFFVAVRGMAEYWEGNLSPSGHWNLYHFYDERKGQRRPRVWRLLPFEFHRDARALRIDVEVDFGGVIDPRAPLEIGVTSILEHRSGRLSYWALAHPVDHPDFHDRRGFRLRI